MTRKERLVQVKINTKVKKELLASFSPGSNLQKFVDMSVARHSDPYAPSDTTYLRKSVFVNTDFGSGQIKYTIYGNKDGRNTWNDDRANVFWQDGINHGGLRGPRWVQRWWNGGGREVLDKEIKRFTGR